MAVGGFRDTARTDSVILIRTGSGDGEPMARTMNLGEVLAAGTREPLALAPHDVVFVPRTAIADANIWVRQHITDLIPFIRGLGATMPLVP
jgi:protein involved in polysaccharide export with SLBB domain